MELFTRRGWKTRRSWSSCALENGIQIAVVKVDYDSIGVDAPEDVAKMEKIISHG